MHRVMGENSMKKYIKPNFELETIELDDIILASKNFDLMNGEVDVNENWDNFWQN